MTKRQPTELATVQPGAGRRGAKLLIHLAAPTPWGFDRTLCGQRPESGLYRRSTRSVYEDPGVDRTRIHPACLARMVDGDTIEDEDWTPETDEEVDR